MPVTTVYGARRLWRWLPLGYDELVVDAEVARSLKLSQIRLGGLWTGRRDLPLAQVEALEITRVRVSVLGLLRDFIMGFIWGFLLHLIPAQIISVPESLGSSDTHRKLGMVWGALWLASFLMMLWPLRSWVLRIRTTGGRELRFHAGDGPAELRQVVQLLSDGIGDAGLSSPLLQGDARTRPGADLDAFQDLGGPGAEALLNTEKPRWYSVMRPRLPLILGLGSFLLLWVNAGVTFYFVQKCMDCGGCRDNGPPRPGCYSGI